MPSALENKPYLEFHIDREEAARYGIQIQTVQQIIMTAIGGMNLTYTVEGRGAISDSYPLHERVAR